MTFAISAACFRVRQRIRNSSFPCFPFQTAYAPPTPIATRTFPVLGGTLYFGIFVGWAPPTPFQMVGNAHPTQFTLVPLPTPLQSSSVFPRRLFREPCRS